jgi:mono/diheme cytochrome c family protein
MMKTLVTLASVSVATFAAWTMVAAQSEPEPMNPAAIKAELSGPAALLGPARPGQPTHADERAAAAAATPTDPVQALGHGVFVRECSSCHGAGHGNPGFERKPGTDALFYKYKGELPALLEKRTDLTPETVALFVRQGITLMAPFRKTEINDKELAALGAYLSRNNPDMRNKAGNPKRR